MIRYLLYIKGFFKWKNYGRLTLTTIVTIILGTVVYRFTEGWSWLDSYYFSVMTLTTVGYGDLYPTTAFTKIFTTVYVLSGLGVILNFVTVFFEYRNESIEKITDNNSK